MSISLTELAYLLKPFLARAAGDVYTSRQALGKRYLDVVTHVWRWNETNDEITEYDADWDGVSDALNAAESGECVLIPTHLAAPSPTLIELASGVRVFGFGTTLSNVYLDLASDCLVNGMNLNLSHSDIYEHYGVRGPADGAATFANGNITITQANASGRCAAVYHDLGGQLVVSYGKLYALNTAGQGHAVWRRISGGAVKLNALYVEGYSYSTIFSPFLES